MNFIVKDKPIGEAVGHLMLTLTAQQLERLLPIIVPFQIDSIQWDAGCREVAIYCSGSGLFPQQEGQAIRSIHLAPWARDAEVLLKEINTKGSPV